MKNKLNKKIEELKKEIEDLEFNLKHTSRVESAWSIEEDLVPLKSELKGLQESKVLFEEMIDEIEDKCEKEKGWKYIDVLEELKQNLKGEGK